MIEQIKISTKELNFKLEEIINEKQAKINEVNNNWAARLNETVEHEGKEYTFQERYLIAKEQRAKIIKHLNLVDETDSMSEEKTLNCRVSAKDIIRYGKMLEAFDEFIAKYESEECDKEKKINAIKYDNEAELLLIKEKLNEIIINIDEEITRLAQKSSKVDLTIDEITELSEARIAMLKFKEEIKKLFTYSFYSVSTRVVADLPVEYLEVIEYFCKKIEFLRINMNKKLEEAKKETVEEASEITEETVEETEEIIEEPIISPVVAVDYEVAKELVETAEKTEKSEDFMKALDALKDLEEERDALAARLNELRKRSENTFILLLDEIKEQIATDFTIDKDMLLELEDRYKYVSKDIAKQYASDFENIIVFNNNLKQEQLKEEYEVKKDGFFAKVGKLTTFVKGSKIATKVRLKSLEKIREFSINTDKPKEKEVLYKMASKIESKMVKSSIVGGLKLFVAQRKLESLKPKLYKNSDFATLSEKKQNRLIKKFDKVTKKIQKQMTKGLNAKTSVEPGSRDVAISIIDQYLYLIATGNDYDESIEKLECYLESVEKYLTDSESYAIREQMHIIKDYRDATNGDIYEIKSNVEEDKVTTELDDIVKYYDSEDYAIGFRSIPIYIKR